MTSLRRKIELSGKKLSFEIAKLAIGTLLFVGIGVAIAILYGFGYLLLVPFAGYALFLFFLFSSYGACIRQRKEKDQAEFVKLFTYFSIYIDNGFNVYKAIESTIPFASPSLSEKLQALLARIDVDKSVLPFADFAAYFPDPKIKEVMVSIYQMVEEGSRSRYLVQFHRLFGKLSEEKRSDEAKRRLSKLDALSFLPLLGAMMSLLMLALAVGQIIGGILGGV